MSCRSYKGNGGTTQPAAPPGSSVGERLVSLFGSGEECLLRGALALQHLGDRRANGLREPHVPGDGRTRINGDGIVLGHDVAPGKCLNLRLDLRCVNLTRP